MYFKEEIQITKDDEVIIYKLGELLCLSEKIDGYFYTHDQEFFVQMGLFTNSEFVEAYERGFGRYFSDRHYYKWVRSNVISKFTALLEALFNGLLEQFKEDEVEDGILTYKNCCRVYRSYNVATQTEQQEESTQEVNSRILDLQEVKLYENDELIIEDNLIQVMPCFHIKVVEQQEKVDAIIKKELIQEIRTLVYHRMCTLLEANFKRANCVEIIQYRLILASLVRVIDASFKPRFKTEHYDSFEVAKNVTVNLKSEFDCFKARYAEFKHYKKNLIRL